MEGSLAIIGFFGFLVAVIVGPIWLRERTKLSAHRVISEAIAKGQSLDPAVMDQLTASLPTQRNQQGRPRRTLGNAIIMLALSGGLVASAYFTGEFDPSGHSWGGQMTGAAILGALGLAFLILALVDYASKPKNPPQE